MLAIEVFIIIRVCKLVFLTSPYFTSRSTALALQHRVTNSDMSQYQQTFTYSSCCHSLKMPKAGDFKKKKELKASKQVVNNKYPA